MRYAGGKGGAGVVQKIINQIPPHEVYIEAFLGGGAVMRAKRPARCSIAIERDTRAAALWTGKELPEFTIVNGDAVAWLADYRCTGREFIYCDPPYMMAARSSQRPIYRFELTNRDHLKLLRALKRLACPVALSGYWSELYARELAGWRAIRFSSVKRSGALGVEWLWMNYPEPTALHDYRFLGRNFRERERIGRRVKRWRLRLDRLPVLERRAIITAVVQTVSVSPFPAIFAGEYRQKKRCLCSRLAGNDDSSGGIARSGGARSATSTTAILREGGHTGRNRHFQR